MTASHIWTPYFNAALSNTVDTVRSDQGELGGWFVYNPNSSAAFIQLFDTAGTITLGTTAPKFSLPLPAGAAANLGLIIPFLNSIKVAATTTATGNTAPSSALVCTLFYK